MNAMKTNNTKWMAWAGFAFAAILFVAWKRTDYTPTNRPAFTETPQDTIPARKKSSDKKEYKIGDLDEAMKELDHAMTEMNTNIKIDFSKMDKEMKAAMQELKNVDLEKVNREIKTALKNVDWDKTRTEVDKAMHEVEFKMKDIDIEKQLAMAKESINAAKISSHIDMQKIKESVEKGLEGARVGLEKAKKELSQLKEFTEALEKDGLINKKKGFKIEIKNGEMYINGTKQSKEVNEKYKKYFKDEDYTIRSDGDDISSI